MNLLVEANQMARKANAFTSASNMIPTRSMATQSRPQSEHSKPLTSAYATNVAHQNAFKASMPTGVGMKLNIRG